MPQPIPEKCPKCDKHVTVFEYGYMAVCATHGIVADNRADDIKARERRQVEDVCWRTANTRPRPIKIDSSAHEKLANDLMAEGVLSAN